MLDTSGWALLHNAHNLDLSYDAAHKEHNIPKNGQISIARFNYLLSFTYSFIIIFNSIMSSAVIINGLDVIAARISNEQQACNPSLSIALDSTNKQTNQWSSKASNKKCQLQL